MQDSHPLAIQLINLHSNLVNYIGEHLFEAFHLVSIRRGLVVSLIVIIRVVFFTIIFLIIIIILFLLDCLTIFIRTLDIS